MRSAFRLIADRTYRPLLVKYLSKAKYYQHDGIRLIIPPEVFHPGFFFSTKLLLRYIRRFPLQHRRFLELGAGSGLISMVAAKNDAIVTATDINPVAVEYLMKNATANDLRLTIIDSDLFQNIPAQQFDVIAINPPYYKKTPKNFKDYAWYCGENGEYFSRLFFSLGDYARADTLVLMILCEGCDIDMVRGSAAQNGFDLRCVYRKQNLFEKDFIFEIKRF